MTGCQVSWYCYDMMSSQLVLLWYDVKSAGTVMTGCQVSWYCYDRMSSQLVLLWYDVKSAGTVMV